MALCVGRDPWLRVDEGGKLVMRENGNLLPYLDRAAIEAAYAAAPGREFDSGKFFSPESSAALAANAFGLFFSDPELLPPLPGTEDCGWPALSVRPEATLRFPWRGGRHPWLDVVAETATAIIGVESKRYEPFRPRPKKPPFSEAYSRPVWGDAMAGYQRSRDELKDGTLRCEHLDAVQLIKHGLGLLAAGWRTSRRPVLVYLFAEPDVWPDGRPIPRLAIDNHRREIAAFSERVRDDAVRFIPISYRALLQNWRAASGRLAEHAFALEGHFAIAGRPAGNPLWRSDDEPASSQERT